MGSVALGGDWGSPCKKKVLRLVVRIGAAKMHASNGRRHRRVAESILGGHGVNED